MKEVRAILKEHNYRFTPTMTDEIQRHNKMRDREYEEWLDSTYKHDDYYYQEQEEYYTQY
jgi:hypothetical protein